MFVNIHTNVDNQNQLVKILWALTVAYDDLGPFPRIMENTWTHCSLVTPHGDMELGKHWLGLPDGTKPLPEPMSTCHK